MTQLLDPALEELIDRLDPYRDYGDLGYDALVSGVRAGLVTLTHIEGATSRQPLIINRVTGKIMKGTGSAYRAATWQRPLESNKRRFQERADDDFDKMYAALVQSAFEDRDPRSMKIWWEHFLGQPQRVMEGGATKEVVDVMAALANRANRQVEYIDAETGEPAP